MDISGTSSDVFFPEYLNSQIHGDWGMIFSDDLGRENEAFF